MPRSTFIEFGIIWMPAPMREKRLGIWQEITWAGYWETVLDVDGEPRLTLSVSQLESLPLHEATLPIACVEGWSAIGKWGGVRFADFLKRLKEIIHEKFGDGIMNAIDFSMDIGKEENPKGDRVIINLNGKFLPYKSW